MGLIVWVAARARRLLKKRRALAKRAPQQAHPHDSAKPRRDCSTVLLAMRALLEPNHAAQPYINKLLEDFKWAAPELQFNRASALLLPLFERSPAALTVREAAALTVFSTRDVFRQREGA